MHTVETKISNPLNKNDPFVLLWDYNESIFCLSCKHQGLWAMRKSEETKEDPLGDIIYAVPELIEESKPIYYLCTSCHSVVDVTIITTTRHMGPVFKQLISAEKKINKLVKTPKPKIKNALDRMEV